MFTHILVPLDGSAHAEAALEMAGRLAREQGARVSVLYALDVETQSMAPFEAEVDPDAFARVRRFVEEALERVAAGGVAVGKAVAANGSPALSIVDFARSEDVDLIVMSTHGLGAHGGYALGSVAFKVLMSAPCPVLLRRIDQ
jgi:nucleotide-binding universal stress UspA family protein